MPGKQFFTDELNRLVKRDYTKLRIVLRDGSEVYVSEILETHDDYVLLRFYERAAKHIKSSTSELLTLEPPSGQTQARAIRFDAMAFAETIEPNGSKIRFE